MGKTLVAIDGSTIAFKPMEGGLAREIASNGGVQTVSLYFINTQLGTVARNRDARTVIGVFRVTGTDIDIQYADGSSERIGLIPEDGLTMETNTAGKHSCTAWYPEGHVFSLEERKAALAQFATRLGLVDAPKQDPASLASCAKTMAAPAKEIAAKTDTGAKTDAGVKNNAGVKSDAAKVAAPEKSAALLPPPKTSSDVAAELHALATGTAAAAAPAPAGAVAEKAPLEVRTSQVHPIDLLPAVATQPQGQDAQRGASACLSVERDGARWGFRNRCGYDVQFAYCLMNGGGPLTSCNDGAVPGGVAANGFGALVGDEGLKDATHSFRWVACQGGAGEVIPRLDQTEPPLGRCVH